MKEVITTCPQCDGHRVVFFMSVKDTRKCSLCKGMGTIGSEIAKKWWSWAKMTKSLAFKKMDDVEVMFLLSQRERKVASVWKVEDVHPVVEKMQLSFKLAN